MGSSSLLEFFVSLVIGILAILAGLFCIAFLLVEPIRSPPSEGPTVAIEEILKSGECGDIIISMEPLPLGCGLNNQTSIPMATCSKNSCTCPDDLLAQNALCCCQATSKGAVSGIQCKTTDTPPPLMNTTSCGCGLCDVEVVVDLTVVAMGSGDPIAAASVYQNSTLLGITETFGQFRYRTVASMRSLMFTITASGYLTQYTDLLLVSPTTPRIMRRVTMIPNMDVVVGMGNAPLHFSLGPMLSVTAPPGVFETSSGEPYEGPITYKGNVIDISDSSSLDVIPGGSLEYQDEESGEMRYAGVVTAIALLFVDEEGSPLVVKGNLTIVLSLSEESGEGEGPEGLNMFFLNYESSSATWKRGSTLKVSGGGGGSRRKRQTIGTPRIAEGDPSNSLGLLNVIGSSLGARCWLQARVFPDAPGQLTPPNSIITMEQTVIISNMIILVRVNTYSGAGQTSVDNLASNAVCSPTVCSDIRTGSLVARDSSTNMRHIPIPFDDTTFDSVENGPLIISTEFVYDELITATSTRPRPFYLDLDSCIAQGQETDAASSSSDYFSFQDVNQFEMPASTASCFVKVQIRDCFTSNEVRITSVNQDRSEIRQDVTVSEPAPPATTEPLTTDPPVTEPSTTEFDGSGDGATTDFNMDGATTAEEVITTAEDVVTTNQDSATTAEVPFVCNDQTATLRAACLQYTCGDLVRVLVSRSPEAEVIANSNFCGVTDRSVFLSTSFFSNNGIVDQLVVNTADVLTSDYNNPFLGLYADTSGSATASVVAMERCNAGVGEDALSTSIDVETGIAAVFSCF